MSFTAQIASFGPRAAQRVDKVRRAVTLKLFSAIILDTPVDTGRLRANWRTSIAKPVLESRELMDKAGSLPIAEATKTTNESTGDEPVFLTNNLPYAYRIEFEGWSHTKAPQGMVRRNVIRFARLIDLEARGGRRER